MQDHTHNQNNMIGFTNPGSVTEENESSYTGLQRHISGYDKLEFYEKNHDSGYMVPKNQMDSQYLDPVNQYEEYEPDNSESLHNDQISSRTIKKATNDDGPHFDGHGLVQDISIQSEALSSTSF